MPPASDGDSRRGGRPISCLLQLDRFAQFANLVEQAVLIVLVEIEHDRESVVEKA